MTALAKRSCGECTVCCTALKIASPEFRKKAHTPCRHLTRQGCGIYAARYPVCREFLCGWRLFAEMGEAWRPDRSGVLAVRLGADRLPPQYQSIGYGVELAVLGGAAAVTPALTDHVRRLLKRGIAVYLSAASPSTLVNVHLDAAADAAAAQATLLRLYDLAHAARWSRGPLMLPALYRLQLAQARALLEKPAKPAG